MNNAIEILSEEKIRLENLNVYVRQRFEEVASPAMVPQKTTDSHGDERVVNYIDLDRFTPEQRQQYDAVCKQFHDVRARLCVFDSYVKSMVPQETIQSFNQHVPSLEQFQDMTIPCSVIELDSNTGDFSKSYMRVGPQTVECPREMSFDQYSQMYTNHLTSSLLLSLGNNVTREQATQMLAEACESIYLHPPKPTIKREEISENQEEFSSGGMTR